MEPTRIRQFFPETLYSNPAVITDESGRGRIVLDVADSITSWRISALASTMDGQVGSATAPLQVFQEFFVDLDLPLGVTQGDVVSVPVAVYNYLSTEQTIRLSMKEGSWFSAQGEATKTINLGPNQVSSVYFPIRANALGKHSLTVEARSGSLSDAVKRELTVYPNGQENTEARNGVIKGSSVESITIPGYAIPGASKLFVKIYPGTLSQAIDGLEGLLGVPHGCFEQTSSITYPNVLIMKYLRAAGKDKPEISMKAEQYINLGYQRLLTFEVDGGGFDWYGNPPANTVLTAYGIMQFHDMNSVHPIDMRLIERAAELLARRQGPDGSWEPDGGASTWHTVDSRITLTAYVAWCLAEAGYTSSESAVVGRACEYIARNLDTSGDLYTIALAANALVAAGHGNTKEVLDRLAERANVRKDRASWPTSSSTLTYSSGDIAAVETTALATYAFLQSRTHVDRARQGLAELAATMDPAGGWGTTQATILALKALFAGWDAGSGGRTNVNIRVNGASADAVRLSGDDSDVLHVVDATRLLRSGKNTIELTVSGGAQPVYQIVARYYIPWTQVEDSANEAIDIDVNYSQLRVEKGGTIDVSAQVRAADNIKMAIVDIGVPPGFRVDTASLEALKSKRTIDRYELTHRQLIIYLQDLRPDRPFTIRYGLVSLYPVRVTSPVSRAYDYYNPDTVQGIAKPVVVRCD